MAIEAWDKFGELLAIVWQFKATYGDLQKKKKKKKEKRKEKCNFRELLASFWQNMAVQCDQYCMEAGKAYKSIEAWGARRAIEAWKSKQKAKQFVKAG